jgi:hypothetical protein
LRPGESPLPRPLVHRKDGPLPVDTIKDNAPPAHPSTEECFVCYDGLVFIGYLELTEEGEEIEVITSVPCKRCADTG